MFHNKHQKTTDGNNDRKDNTTYRPSEILLNSHE